MEGLLKDITGRLSSTFYRGEIAVFIFVFISQGENLSAPALSEGDFEHAAGTATAHASHFLAFKLFGPCWTAGLFSPAILPLQDVYTLWSRPVYKMLSNTNYKCSVWPQTQAPCPLIHRGNATDVFVFVPKAANSETWNCDCGTAYPCISSPRKNRVEWVSVWERERERDRKKERASLSVPRANEWESWTVGSWDHTPQDCWGNSPPAPHTTPPHTPGSRGLY